ncbi:PIN domain-containing protein [Iningainema tapete]|uniref:Type II toxin-antitoxin system VapC family toxin n=1 Tax=Iningainema tapete BLCC-T55 TaxID=2748662 RepID=A0A8J6XMY3_9CYAN|nr:type II toxin-antitoxin system VapC family toxin [Iningainema tapete BLCC-T55]
MTAYFLDSSVLVKRYVSETGSAWIQQIADPQTGNLLFIARISWVEVNSALARRQREGNLSVTDVNQIIHTFRYDLDTQYQVVELDLTLVETAGQLVRQYPLKAYDAIQLASVLRIQSIFAQAQSTLLVFLTADDRLIAAAQAEGLLTDNPNYYA